MFSHHLTAAEKGYSFHTVSSRCAAPGRKRLSYMKAKDFDKKFDAGQNVTSHLDLLRAARPGVTRQSSITLWIAERLEKTAA